MVPSLQNNWQPWIVKYVSHPSTHILFWKKGTQESTGLISTEHLCMAYFSIQEFTHKYVKMLFLLCS